MKILNFIEATKLSDKPENERATLLCFYHYKETSNQQFTMPLISDLLVKSGFNAPNKSRLKGRLTKGKDKAFIPIKGKTGAIEFVPVTLHSN